MSADDKAADRALRIFRPRTLNGLVNLCLRNPEALLFAGGTAILSERRRVPGKVIYLGKVEELSRISRTLRYLEIGSCLTLSRILGTGRNILPEALSDALRGIGSPSVRNLATLGGNLCSAWPWNDALPPLYAIEAQVELRSASGARWLELASFITGAGQTVLRPGEVLTRIRVPLEEWDFQTYRRVSRHRSSSRALVSLCGLARMSRGAVESVRLALGGVGGTVFRNRELEVQIEGNKLPITTRVADALVERAAELLNPMTDQYSTARYRKAVALRLLRWYIQRLNSRSLELM